MDGLYQKLTRKKQRKLKRKGSGSMVIKYKDAKGRIRVFGAKTL